MLLELLLHAISLVQVVGVIKEEIAVVDVTLGLVDSNMLVSISSFQVDAVLPIDNDNVAAMEVIISMVETSSTNDAVVYVLVAVLDAVEATNGLVPASKLH